MCLLVRVAANTDFPFDWFEDVHQNNPDGIGIMYVQDGKIVQMKSLAPFARDAYAFWYNNAPKDTEYAMHFRWKTHGAIDVERVHPYKVNDTLLLMHNGVLQQSITGRDDDKNKSDTQIFAEQLGAELSDTVFNEGVAKLLGAAIGTSNRFIYLSADKGLLTINEKTGVTTDRFPGCWFSNTYAWTPSKWGVYSGKFGGAAHPYANAWASGWDLMGDDDTYDRAYLGHITSYAKGEVVKPTWEGEVNEKDLSELEDFCDSLFVHVAQSIRVGDLAAARFQQVFSSPKALMEFLPGLYESPAEACGDIASTLYCVESGQADYDDVLAWFSNGEVDDEDDEETPNEASLEVVAATRSEEDQEDNPQPDYAG
jgi:hypothetical protein